MPLITIKANPSRWDLRVFAVLWLAFFLLLGGLAYSSSRALLVAALVTGACFLVSIAVNRDFSKRSQLLGVAIPGVLLSIWGGEAVLTAAGLVVVAAQRVVFGMAAGVGVAGAVATLVSRGTGARLYRGWMLAALPIGWTISHFLLAILFFGVMMPIGWIRRLSGKDQVRQAFDRAAPTYWAPRERVSDSARYFRQF